MPFIEKSFFQKISDAVFWQHRILARKNENYLWKFNENLNKISRFKRQRLREFLRRKFSS